MGACLQKSSAVGSAEKAREFLLRTRNQDGGWAYTPHQPSSPEPSSLASLAVCDSPKLAWIDKPGPQWSHSLILLTLRTLGQRPDRQKQLVESLLSTEVRQIKTDKSKNDIDGSLRGWSWVDGTFSWVEPTSYALLALKNSGVLDHARVREAERLLLNRTCPDGGWNYGNTVVRGATLTSMTATTALAALALQRAPGSEKAISRAMEFLDREVQSAPSALALGLTILCFDAFGRPSMHLQERLISRQASDGSWRGQPHLTALAALALATRDGKNVFKS